MNKRKEIRDRQALRNNNRNPFEKTITATAFQRELNVQDYFSLKNITSQEFQIVTAASFDFERTLRFSIEVVCTDRAVDSMTSIKNISVHVLDVNDNKPIFEHQVGILTFDFILVFLFSTLRPFNFTRRFMSHSRV